MFFIGLYLPRRLLRLAPPPLLLRCLGHLQIECSFGLGAAASVAQCVLWREGRRGMEEGEMYGQRERGRGSVK